MLSARDGCEAVVYSTKVVLSSSHGGKGLDPMFTHYPILSSSCGSRLLSSCAVWAELQGPSQASVHHQNLLQHARTSMALTITSPPPGQKKGRAPAPLLLRDTMLGFFFFSVLDVSESTLISIISYRLTNPSPREVLV